MTNKNNNAGYTGQSAADAGAFYAPYIPLSQNLDRQAGWRNKLQTLGLYYSGVTESTIEVVQACMQQQWPGPYRVVGSTVEQGPVFRTRYGDVPGRERVEFRLHFDNPADETWWHLKYD